MSNSVRPHRWQPTRLCCPWDSPGKNTGVGCPFLLQCMEVKSESEVAQLCPTLSDPMDCSLNFRLGRIKFTKTHSISVICRHTQGFLDCKKNLTHVWLSNKVILYAQSLSGVSLFVIPWTVVWQASLSMGFSRQEYWSGLPFSPSGDLRNPGINCIFSQILGCK